MNELQAGQKIILLADWELTISDVNDRLWTALECDRHPTVASANARIDARADRMREILARGTDVDYPHQEWVDGAWKTVPTMRKPQPKDERTLNKLSREQQTDRELVSRAPITIEAASVLEVLSVSLVTVIWQPPTIRLNIVSTSMEALKFKKDGGKLTNGKRKLWVPLSELSTCSYEII